MPDEIAHLRAHYHWPSGLEAIGGADPDQDCNVKKLAYEYSLHLQPERAPLREVFDALELGTKCGLPGLKTARAYMLTGDGGGVGGGHMRARTCSHVRTCNACPRICTYPHARALAWICVHVHI